MTLNDRIASLRSILNKHSPAEINKLYKESEVSRMKEYFTKYPDVKYSDYMQKRMIREARSKKLTAKQQEMIAELIDMANGNGVALDIDKLNKTTLQWINKLTEVIDNTQAIELIHIEHDYDPDSQILEAWADDRYEESLTTFTTDYDLTSAWGILNTNRFEALSEKLEQVDVENQEYSQIFDEILKLQSYQLIGASLAHPEVKETLEKSLQPKLQIVIGEHDNWHYKIYPH